MSITLRSLLTGLATYIPGVSDLATRRGGGGTASARYCYTVWLRHVSMLNRSALRTTFGTVVELGPGDSLGIGLAAILSGAERYVALDLVRYASNARNREILEELISLFQASAPIPDEAEFPRVQPRLPSYEFPREFLTSERLARSLAPRRLDAIRAAVVDPCPDLRRGASLCYIAPWDSHVIADGTVDLILSQAVLQYPPNLEELYVEMSRWLNPGGVMSHEVDFKSHGATVEWNGHWSCSDEIWRLAQGKRRGLLNREPHSTHIALLHKMGFRVVGDERAARPSDITRTQLAARFRHLTDEDLTTSSALIQAVKQA